MLKSLGVCLGSSNIQAVELIDGEKISRKLIRNHDSNPKQVLAECIGKFNDYDYIAVTGRKFKEFVNLPAITEPEAVEYSLRNKKPNALITLGSENFILYKLNNGNVTNVITGSKCASGTGEFFLQQVGRMNIDVESAIKLAKNSEPYRVSGRCSVFCKSDCTHALNKGTPIGRVCAGLGNMMADKVLELLRGMDKKDVMLVGGVTKNGYVVGQLQKSIENLEIPPDADVFEALGAAIYAYKNKTRKKSGELIKKGHDIFYRLPALADAEELVEFKELKKEKAAAGDECIIGLDVGSTTTKAVLLRTQDNAVLADIYLRTNGDPVRASKECYHSLYEQLEGLNVTISGLGVTGSGRHIAGLFSLSEAIINEIIAHATAAAYFDKDVDTILEIGGQDAKYTYLVNGVPCDYAMNEACSAGTGSFLEESAKESLNIDCLEIAGIAMRSHAPCNFNDQCAAFISSDIKNASNEGVSCEDIIAGLVYSICMNYNNRVKGARKVGNRVFMQGGVCYNRAIPPAMANILKKKIVVPPEPGLMGAFGVALEVKKKIGSGLLQKQPFDLQELKDREVEYGKVFTCAGAGENCDRGCTVNVIKINGKNYPFGGACNKYYNILHGLDVHGENLVSKRQELIFDQGEPAGKKTVGMLRAFLMHALYPLYFHFFSKLGMKVVLSDKVDGEGVQLCNSELCFPAEIAHGCFMNILKKDVDYIFLPQVQELYVKGYFSNESDKHSCCYIMQAEPYILRSAFRDVKPHVLNPVFNFSKGWGSQEKAFVKLAQSLGFKGGKESYRFAVEKYETFLEEEKEMGNKLLRELETDRSKVAIVLFGRSYNAYAVEANLGIPKKFTSRGCVIIPYECLPFDDESPTKNMYWANGQKITKAAKFVKNHPQLFAAYITNFSCGPDSFLVTYFRDIMKTKPSLTLELDSHSADAGINTRIEAFLDIVDRYRRLGIKDKKAPNFRAAGLVKKNGEMFYIDSRGKNHDMKECKLLFPSMGRFGSEGIAAVFESMGYESEAVPVPDFDTLMIGRANTGCKECMPLILCTASLLRYLKERKKKDELLLYFMPESAGNCRFAQYNIFLRNLIRKKQIKDTAIFTLSSANGYAGLGSAKALKILKIIIVSDVIDDIYSAISAIAEDSGEGKKILEEEWQKILDCFRNNKNLNRNLREVSAKLSRIPLKQKLKDAKKVLLAGEIYVRKDSFSPLNLIEILLKNHIVVLRGPLLEWFHYTDYNIKHKLSHRKRDLSQKVEFTIKQLFKHRIEKQIKKILAKSGLYEYHPIDIEQIIKEGGHYIPETLLGEAILTIGSIFHEVKKNVHGAISLGPFSCMPSRIVEAILSQECDPVKNKSIKKIVPFLPIETDGNPYPQVVEARIESFCLQVERSYHNKKSNRDKYSTIAPTVKYRRK
jgi:predicted CoA-substrate-specific enzyme activase